MREDRYTGVVPAAGVYMVLYGGKCDMPKMKTNRLARKKLRVSAGGKVSRARANTSHNTGKKSAKRMRQLRGSALVHSANVRAVRAMLPYGGVKG